MLPVKIGTINFQLLTDEFLLETTLCVANIWIKHNVIAKVTFSL